MASVNQLTLRRALLHERQRSVEGATGIVFSDNVREADVCAGTEARLITTFDAAFTSKKASRRRVGSRR